MKSDNKIVLIGAAIGAGLLWLIKKNKQVDGIGKVERIKRRIYKEVSMAQDAGVDFTKKWEDLLVGEKDELLRIGKEVGWKQSKIAHEKGVPYTKSYYNSLRRAWNAVSGVEGIGRAYDVRDANGKVVLTWIDAAEDHVAAEETNHAHRTVSPNIYFKKQEKKKTKADLKQEEYAERLEFAEQFLSDYEKEQGQYITNYLNQTHPNGTTFRDVIVDEFAQNKLKVRDKNNTAVDVYIEGEWHSASLLFVIVSALLDAWRTRGLQADNLDEIRRDLLEKAKFMGVSADGTAWGAPIQGDDRYNYLDLINWIVVTIDHYDNGEKTIYPYRAFDQEWAANMFSDKLRKHRVPSTSSGFRRTFKVMPITELDFESISGL